MSDDQVPARSEQSEGDGASTETKSTSLARVPARTELEDIEFRRAIVARLRFGERLAIQTIVLRLSKLDPPIIATRSTVHRDLENVRREFRRTYNVKRFDALAVVGEYMSAFERVARKSMRAANNTKDAAEKNQFFRTYLDALSRQIELLQDSDLLNKRIGTLIVDDGKRRDRIPSGTELQRRFESVNVVDAELVSEAERAILFGDAAAADKAARDAKGGDHGTGGEAGGDTGDDSPPGL